MGKEEDLSLFANETLIYVSIYPICIYVMLPQRHNQQLSLHYIMGELEGFYY